MTLTSRDVEATEIGADTYFHYEELARYLVFFGRGRGNGDALEEIYVTVTDRHEEVLAIAVFDVTSEDFDQAQRSDVDEAINITIHYLGGRSFRAGVSIDQNTQSFKATIPPERDITFV